MKTVLILWLLGILFSPKIQAITHQVPLSGAEQIQLSTDTIIDRLWQQTNLFSSEKIHLHTDRLVYAGGDTIWFRAYLVNALDNRPETASKYIYSELIDPFGNSVSKAGVEKRFKLPVAETNTSTVLPDSSYTIYTSLLLSSDLKGHIEDLGWYFRGDDHTRKKGLDQLMLTQGWRKYHVENALAADYKQPTILSETSRFLFSQICNSTTEEQRDA